MPSIEKIRAVRKIVVHDNCADGMASALFLHDALPEAEIVFVQYGTTAHKELAPEPGMLFCDFSPHPDYWLTFRFANAHESAIVLDHHKTAQEIVAGFGEDGVFGDEVADPGICGAYLAYREVWSKLMPPAALATGDRWARRIAQLCGVRDTWLNKHEDWKQACVLAEAMRFFPAESWLDQTNPFETERPEIKVWWDSRIETGKWLFQKNLESVNKALESSYRFKTSRGTRVVMFEGVRKSSDAAEAMGNEADLIIGFDYLVEKDTESKQIATLILSTRSHTGYNCAEMCKRNGGGGHTAAAGCSIKFDLETGSQDPFSSAQLLVERYEASPDVQLAVR